MGPNEIKITKARVHNLKDISLSIPKNTLTVITGPSGSGKSSLAFDTIYVEGQRRYIESLSSYARQFLGVFQPPDVESIEGLSPAIAIDQKTSSKNPRSTVGTTTEIYDYLRILFARVGDLYSKNGTIIKKFTPAQIVREALLFPEGTKVWILAPLFNKQKINLSEELAKISSQGFTRVRLDGTLYSLEEIDSKKSITTLEVVVDRFVVKPDIAKRVTDSVEYALKLSGGKITLLIDEKKELTFFDQYIDPDTGTKLPELEPRLFSFNSPLGACEKCNGLGESKVFDKRKMILDDNLSINDGAIKPISKKNSFLLQMITDIAATEKVDLDRPLNKLPKKFVETVFHGSEKVYTYSFTSATSNFDFSKAFAGIISSLERKYLETDSDKTRLDLESYMDIKICPECNGGRLNKIALSTKIDKKNIIEISEYSAINALKFFEKLELPGDKKIIAQKLIKEISSRLKFLVDVGVGYLSLNRAAMTLSGGEAQRIRLATQIGSALSGVLYVLDEPSIGLHQRDNSKLIKTLKHLRDLGNTVLVVEHDEETMREADFIVDLGPGAGLHGGKVVSLGDINHISKEKRSLTGRYLSGVLSIEIPAVRRKLTNKINIKSAVFHNLKKIDVEIPLGGLVCICGVSGSGKSTLIHDILVPAVKTYLKDESLDASERFNSITGVDKIDSIIELDQSPIGRTPHSNPATYTGLFDEIRDLFSRTPDAQIRGYRPGRFSFNVKGGRCEECEGNGVKKIEMHFLPDVFITCSECNGSRYNQETLSVRYKDKNISDVLEMSIEEAHGFFKNHPKMERILKTLTSIGLGYMKLGQPATTLSGGEAQRMKLARELAKKPRGHCLYVLDEPTTGLHFHDIHILIKAMNNLIDVGHSMIVIEHNLDVIKTADHVIEMGPEGGDLGGHVTATGTPEDIAKTKNSPTGEFLKRII